MPGIWFRCMPGRWGKPGFRKGLFIVLARVVLVFEK
jgi:hypothetical protein